MADWGLVTDGETRAVVAAIRGLHAGGMNVTAVAGATPAPALWSRACSAGLTLPHPLVEPDAFVAGIAEELKRRPHRLVVPGSDASLSVISARRTAVEEHAPTALPPHDAVLAALDKVRLIDAARAAGLASPRSAVCAGVPDALAASEELGYPVLLKPARTVYTVNGQLRRSGSVLVSAPEELTELAPGYGEPCLLQRRVPGRLVSFGGVIAGGRLIGTAVSVYRRTWRPETGNVAFSTTIDPPPGLGARVERLLSELGWEGIFELELIAAGDGSFAAIDLNPRPYGSLSLAIRAGANLPLLWAEHALGRSPRPEVARAGSHYRWEDADARHFVAQIRRGRLGAARRVLRPHRRVVHAHFELSDPAPFAARLVALAGVAAARARSGIGPGTMTDAGTPPAPPPPVPGHARRRRRRPAQSVSVIGAGPYGLAVTAHLREYDVPTSVFGDPLEFWRTQMPAGMLLRSRRRSSSIADPQRALTIERFEAATGRTLRSPSLRLEEFIDYGLWFQRQVAPDIDGRRAERLADAPGGFLLTLDDGSECFSERVVICAGLFPFARRPAPFEQLDGDTVSHTSEHADLARFEGARVAVVGAGQSALETAALLRESGADVEVLVRAPDINWLPDDTLPQTTRELFPRPPTDVGGRVTGWLAAAPDAFRTLPPRLQPDVAYRCIRPAGSGWLRSRLEQVPITTGRGVREAVCSNGDVRLTLDDGSRRHVDHVMLGTGFEIDVRRYPFLDEALARRIELVPGSGYPKLVRGLESSVEGLHFAGATAALSWGPIFRFVVGTWFAAPAVARRAAGRLDRPLRLSF